MSHSKTAHNWANLTGKAQKGGNVFYEMLGPDAAAIYSYGHHFPLALLDRQRKTVFINNANYSVSTSNHKSDVRQAINRSIAEKEVDLFKTSSLNDIIFLYSHGSIQKSANKLLKKILIADVEARLESVENVFNNQARAHSMYSNYLQIIALKNQVREMKGYAPVKADKKKLAELLAIKTRQEKLVAKNRELQNQRYQDRQARWSAERKAIERKAKFDAIQSMSALNFADPSKGYGEPVSLSIDGNHVLTSNHNQVTISTARHLLAQWQNCIQNRTTFSDKNAKVGDYTGLTMRYNGTVKIGCTRILPDEIIKLKAALAA